ncbi:Glutamate--tRNA ligase [Acholeplasma oculi]|uniref:Glutamate--tRNA ligase n=1 Tax=Acholeplasma oculi TaxID=35623 RepID=A0A061AD82_9MOLU|nr:glutamate--tRNA ligase [Acholeplasma oculi]CDR31389.1 Glutamyl-tRNA synthetase [Acholeplasma oculi]SKC39603.1 nondiscriminating glutamyl-tRNA synthetase [Acholeplasma oculi]SUT91865.1 Glutamate--tRNA ligase [Acholeplasma oculi]
MKKFRARYAPSPTGLLHIGNARTALFNYLFARHHGGDFIIRIEDTDVLRNVKDGEKSQLENLSWLGMTWDEGPDIGGKYAPYHQLKRLDLYKEYANILLEKGLAYKDYKEGSQEYAVRFKVPKDVTYTFDDVIRGRLSFDSKEVEDWIILKDNGIPTYNFAVVIDDHFMEITHVFRGEEHITNTPKQLMVYDAFGWEYPTFGHMTIIVNENKKKLSKRDTDTVQFISDYRKMGYLPEAVLNFLSLLGWSPQSETEILNKEELIKLFDEHRLSAAPSYFDKDKLAFINSRYMKQLTLDQLKDLTRPFLVEKGILIPSETWFENLLMILKDRLSFGAEIVKYYEAFFHDTFTISDEMQQEIKAFDFEPVLTQFLEEIKTVDFDQPTEIEVAIKNLVAKTGIKGKGIFMPLRIASTGEAHGPSLPVSLSLLGKTKVSERIEQTLRLLKGVTQ